MRKTIDIPKPSFICQQSAPSKVFGTWGTSKLYIWNYTGEWFMPRLILHIWICWTQMPAPSETRYSSWTRRRVPALEGSTLDDFDENQDSSSVYPLPSFLHLAVFYFCLLWKNHNHTVSKSICNTVYESITVTTVIELKLGNMDQNLSFC